MKLSVLMSVYAKEKQHYLELSLSGLASQICRADEVVLVEDGPIGPQLSTTIDRYRERLNIQSVVLPQNVGLGAALNKSLEFCGGELVARMDTDDIALPPRFQRQLDAFATDEGLDVLSSYAIEMDAVGQPGRLRTVPVEHEAIVQTMWANPIIHPAAMFRRRTILTLGGYSSTAVRCEDYELWLRCAAAGLRFGNIPEPLIKYRFTPDTHKRQSRKDMWQRGRIGFSGSRKIGLPLWKQLACFVPFIRSLLPAPLQHAAYQAMNRFDPRQRERS